MPTNMDDEMEAFPTKPLCFSTSVWHLEVVKQRTLEKHLKNVWYRKVIFEIPLIILRFANRKSLASFVFIFMYFEYDQKSLS